MPAAFTRMCAADQGPLLTVDGGGSAPARHLHEVGVDTHLIHKLLVAAPLGDLPIAHYGDQIGMPDG